MMEGARLLVDLGQLGVLIWCLRLLRDFLGESGVAPEDLVTPSDLYGGEGEEEYYGSA